ncbi:DUF4158 domain-containing protein [Streptomyces sp. NBC_00846]|nr:DUF4158 domain-containing protein [Streptomyces sp. NBC_00846]
MAVEFLTDVQAARYGAFYGTPARAELERFFFLDDADREKVQAKRRAHNRLGFAVQLTSVRFLGRFMPDPRQVPADVTEYLAEQLGITDASVLQEYGERDGTARSHAGEIQQDGGWRDFAEVRDELAKWLDARAWTTGDGPKALFDAAVGWLRERRVLLPGVTTLARLVASVREAANQRLWDTLYGLLNTGQRAVLDSLLVVPSGQRVSELDRLRRGPVRVSGPQMKWSLERAREIADLGMGELDVSGIPPRRLAELSRYGVDGKATLLRRHGDSRRLATLLSTAVYLTTRAVDDALDLLEVLVATKLLARAERDTAKEKLKTLPKVERAGAKLATAFQVVFDTTSEQVDTDTGEVRAPRVATLDAMWEQIEAVIPRGELAAAIAALFELTPPLDSDADEAWRAMLVTRFGTVRPFLKLLVEVVDFGATPEGLPVLKALRSLPDLMGRKKVGPAEIDTDLLAGSWRRLVLSAPHQEPGAVDWKAYTFCVLEQFHRMLRRKEVYAKNSSKWGDPRAKLLAGQAWEQAKPGRQMQDGGHRFPLAADNRAASCSGPRTLPQVAIPSAADNRALSVERLPAVMPSMIRQAPTSGDPGLAHDLASMFLRPHPRGVDEDQALGGGLHLPVPVAHPAPDTDLALGVGADGQRRRGHLDSDLAYDLDHSTRVIAARCAALTSIWPWSCFCGAHRFPAQRTLQSTVRLWRVASPPLSGTTRAGAAVRHARGPRPARQRWSLPTGLRACRRRGRAQGFAAGSATSIWGGSAGRTATPLRLARERPRPGCPPLGRRW